jgi:hypothetical protein
LSASGFESLRTILFDVNIKEGNLKLIKKYKSVAVQSDSSNKNNEGQGPVYGPNLPGPVQASALSSAIGPA